MPDAKIESARCATLPCQSGQVDCARARAACGDPALTARSVPGTRMATLAVLDYARLGMSRGHRSLSRDPWGEGTDARTRRRMRQVRRRDTPAEMAVRRALHRLGYRFRTRNEDLPGSPDVANRRRRWVVFVHGCFWHAHLGCRRATLPAANRRLWTLKFERNVARDTRVRDLLARMGYRTIVVWECETRSDLALLDRLRHAGFSLPPTLGRGTL